MEPVNPNDPFAQLEEGRTFIKPNPGARTGARPVEPAPSMAAPAGDEPLPEAGLNPLVALANKLLMAMPQIRHTRSVSDVAALRNTLAQSIRDFATEATARGIAPERVMAARYVLCTVLDEAAADTPWGGSGVWANHSLLASFHNETFGGDKVFQLMARLAEKPAANRDLLELIYAALSLGFEGRYRVVDNGRAQLDAVRAKLAQILKKERGDVPPALAQNWQGQPAQGKRALSWLPMAVAAVLGLLLVGGAYVGFSLSLGGLSDPVFEQIQGLRLAPPVEPVAQPAPKPRLAQFLQADIKAQLVTVRDEVDRSVVTVRGDGLFAPASAALLAERTPLMQRIAEALAAVPGTVLVSGHTDSDRIRSARFPSNWHLSEERARSVAELLIASGVPAERVRAEGRADGEPVAPNDTAANKALNRRVEITLMTQRPGVETAAPVGQKPAAASGATR